MNQQLFKQPNRIVFWVVLASGLAVVLTDQVDAGGGVPSAVARTVFWCSAIAYFSVRVFQFATRRNEAAEAEPGPDDDVPDDT